MFAGLCHCRDCLKATGSGFAAYMGFQRSDVSISGETKAYTKLADSGSPTTRHFCVSCGTIVYGDGGESDESSVIVVYAGTLDDPAMFEPHELIFTRNRPDWAAAMTHLPKYLAAPPQ